MVGLALALASCTAGGSTPAPRSPAVQTPGQVQSSGTGISPTDLPTAPQLDDAQGAVADVTFGQCAVAAGTQKLSGTVKNSTKQTTDYVITMNWTNDTYDVAGRGIAVVKNVKGGASQDWTMSAKVASGATRCVPNVLRGQLKS